MTLISGGANVKSFLERDSIQNLILNADRITLAVEKEKNTETQIKTDKGHERQQERLKEIIGEKELRVWRPKQGQGKDLADLNKFHRDKEIAAEMAAKQEMQEKQKKERNLEMDRSRGMSMGR